jgi:hypothetical protein
MSDPGGRVVAELGRPETPQETADRKARERALRRSRQNFRNLAASLVACVAVVVLIALFVPHGDGAPVADIDVQSAAAQYGDTAGQPLLAPKVPADWKSNAAELRGSGSSATWYVGYVIDGTDYAGISEGLPGDAALATATMDGANPTGTTTIGGLPWRVYDRRQLGTDAGNVAYGLATKIGDVVVTVYGTATTKQIRGLAAAVAADAGSRGLDGAGSLP